MKTPKKLQKDEFTVKDNPNLVCASQGQKLHLLPPLCISNFFQTSWQIISMERDQETETEPPRSSASFFPIDWSPDAETWLSTSRGMAGSLCLSFETSPAPLLPKLETQKTLQSGLSTEEKRQERQKQAQRSGNSEITSNALFSTEIRKRED